MLNVSGYAKVTLVCEVSTKRAPIYIVGVDGKTIARFASNGLAANAFGDLAYSLREIAKAVEADRVDHPEHDAHSYLESFRAPKI